MKNTLRTGLALTLSTSALAVGCGGEKISYDGCNPAEAKTEIQYNARQKVPFRALALVYKHDVQDDNGFPISVVVTDETDPNKEVYDPLVLKCGEQVLGYAGIVYPKGEDVEVIPALNADIELKDMFGKTGYTPQFATVEHTVQTGVEEFTGGFQVIPYSPDFHGTHVFGLMSNPG